MNLRSDGSVLKSFIAPHGEASLSGLAWDGTHLWFRSPSDDGIYKLDPDDGSVLEFVPYSRTSSGLTFDGSFLWNNSTDKEICQLEVDIEPAACTLALDASYLDDTLDLDFLVGTVGGPAKWDLLLVFQGLYIPTTVTSNSSSRLKMGFQ